MDSDYRAAPPVTDPLTHDERYLFDLMGFLVIENVLSESEIAALNEAIDRLNPWSRLESGERTAHSNERKMHIGPLLDWGEPFRQLSHHPRVLPYLRAMLGDGMRLDHEYAILMKSGAEGLRLHGGGTPYDPAQCYHYRNERIYCGLTVATFALSDCPPGMGGFCCFPGSHKSNIACPANFKHFNGKQPPCLMQVPVSAGDVLIFTEALTHGTLPWTAPFERRSLLYKFSPGHQSWSRRYLDRDFRDGGDPELRRRLLEPPYHGRRPPTFEDPV